MGSLTPLQHRLLGLLSRMDPPGTLTGGGALAAAHSGERSTRDLDFFWRDRAALENLPDQVRARLVAAGLSVQTIQTSPSFVRIQVGDGVESILLDLVADPTPPIEPPVILPWEDGVLAVDSAHEILVNKLCALLGRAEIRDLHDVRTLMAAGGDLERALRDAPSRGLGFSPLVLAWLLRGLPVERLAAASGWTPELAASLASFRDLLVERLVGLATP